MGKKRVDSVKSSPGNDVLEVEIIAVIDLYTSLNYGYLQGVNDEILTNSLFAKHHNQREFY